MPAPLKGDAARTEVGSTRITVAEKASMIAKYGTVAKAIRAALTATGIGGPE